MKAAKSITLLFSLLTFNLLLLTSTTSLVSGQDRTIESYVELGYSEMQFKLADLATIFPDVMRHERADIKLDIPYLVDCDT